MGAMRTLLIMATLHAAVSLPLRAQAENAQPAPQSVAVHGIVLHYVERGQGTPVIFIHGGLDDYRAWLPHLEAFSRSHRAIAYSRRHNFPNPETEAGRDYSAIVDAADLAALIEKLQLPPAHVVAVSYGAHAALVLASEHPERVRSLVLSEPPLLRWLPELEGGPALYREIMSKVWEPSVRGFRAGDRQGLVAALDGFGQLGYRMAGEKLSFATLPAEMQTYLLANAAEWRALTQSKDAFPRFSPAATRRVAAPTLLLSGERTLELHKVIDRELQRVLPHAERIILPGASHEMWNEVPEACQRAALEFIARH